MTYANERDQERRRTAGPGSSPRRKTALGVGLCAVALCGCQMGSELPNAEATEGAIVYGNDDRAEVYAYSDAAWSAQALQFSVALVLRENLDKTNPNDIRVIAPTLGSEYDLCAGERFADQPVGAYCSGTLIAPDLVLTAGHCVEAVPCSSTDLVFNYRMTGPGTLATLTANDVYSCVGEVVTVDDMGLDYSIIRLNRPVVGRSPAPVARGYRPVNVGDALRVNGHPSGIPMKIADNGVVVDNRAAAHDFFTTNLDIFPGNSGSGVFSRATGELQGVAVRSVDREWHYVTDGTCNRARVIPDNFFLQGGVTYVSRAIDGLCAAMPQHALCHCGDGICDATLAESTVSCPWDCTSRCGDGVCNGRENAWICYADCGQCGNQVCEPTEAEAGNCCMDCGSVAPLQCPSAGRAARPAMGDVDADGVVTSTDARLVTEHFTGLHPTIHTASADVDCSGTIDVLDSLHIAQYAQGSRRRFACDEVSQLGAGLTHTCIQLRSGDVRCWGAAASGQLGYGNTVDLGDQPNEVPALLGNVAIGARPTRLDVGTARNCARFADGGLRCWGYAIGLGYPFYDYPSGHLGDDELPASRGNLNIGGPVQETAIGVAHTCALMQSGAVRCWGLSDMGQTGYGFQVTVGLGEAPGAAGDVQLGGRATRLAGGIFHTCALLEGGAVRCWGFGGHGVLGYGHTRNVGDDETPVTQSPVNVGGTVVQVAAGLTHTCALLQGGSVRCWGAGDKGQLGYGDTADVGDNEAPSSRPVVSLGGTATQVVAGAYSSCALMSSGAVRCWGDNSSGQLGLARLDNIGDNELPSSVAPVDLGGPAVQLAAGGFHVCALLQSGDVRCWGHNEDGRLGYGHALNIGDTETPAATGDVPIWLQASSSCTDATAIDLGAQQTPKTVAGNACLKITAYPGSWVGAVILQTQAGGTGYPIPFTWSNCSQSGASTLQTPYQSRELRPAGASCTTRIRLQGAPSSSVTLKWWGVG